MKLIKLLTFVSSSFASLFVFANPTYAVCPVCTIAVGAGLGISRALGVDDLVTSVWIGGMLMSVTFWTVDWLTKKNKTFKYQLPIVAVLWYAITLIPLMFTKTIGLPLNTIWGVDKIVAGTAIGTVAFLLGKYLDGFARKKYGKQFFQFQKVVFPVSALVISSFILYFVTK